MGLTKRYLEELSENGKDDLEDDPDDLESTEGDPVNFWEAKQRDLVTSVVDYNLGTLADLVESATIDLSPRYQRRFRWEPLRQSRLIESFLMNVPVPPIFLNEDEYGKYSVIDGKQRLTAVFEFLRGRLRLGGLEVFKEINNLTFDELPLSLKAVIKTRPTMRGVIVLRQSDQDVKFEVFKRLNTGGVRLNAQEIRNSTYPGPLNDLILDLSEHQAFHKLLGIKDKRSSAIYRQMRDAELVLRYFTFRTAWKTFNGGMRREMDRFMVTNRRAKPEVISEMREDFLRTLKIVEASLGDHAYRRWNPEKKTWRKQVLAALFDAQMFALRNVDLEIANAHSSKILAGFVKLMEEVEFRKAIDAATNTPSLFKKRVQIATDAVAASLGS